MQHTSLELARATMDERMRVAAHRRTVRAFLLQRRNHRAARRASPDGRVWAPSVDVPADAPMMA